ncbi:AbiTii domain-containing protein [Burkholderia gladioli]|uniref:AbiTii domain-containing protein n=1 Tax=Burkholderia gladioli TaxID=28095 RepID=UPI0019176224|nr:hypothetical protein [Burkholderia gladioli]
MKLLDDIVDLLSDKNGSLTGALLKTKVLLHRIGHRELVEWVSDELDGYKDDNRVPSYRLVVARVVGNVHVPGGRYTNQTLPTAHLPEDVRLSISQWPMPQSISVLETMAQQTQSMCNYFPPELATEFSRGYEAGHVTNAWRQIEPGQVQSIVIAVRSRLLDFVLTLQDEIGTASEENMKEAAKDADAAAIFKHAIFGDNTIIVFGTGNTANVTNTVEKGNFNTLAETLRKAGVEEADVSDLRTAIDEDDPAVVVREKQFGPKVKAWITNMMGKAIGGGWAIGIAAGGKLLADALGAHYGIK